MRPSDLSREAKISDDTQQSVKDFNLFIKQCYRIV